MKFGGAICKDLFYLPLLGIYITILATGCSPSDHAKPTALNPVVKKVDQSNFINGRTFCETYKAITQKEIGHYIPVPVDYDHPEKGTLEIYAYTLSPFSRLKPTYIYVDGGPGQNTHGIMPEYLGGKFNEVRFDQRGLGCSTPATYQQYKDPSLYSSLNNIRDMDLIRKFYGIEEWSVYGVSYGTVPATMYGSRFSEHTTSVVLEGVFGRPDQVHMNSYKAEKLNLALASFSAKQKSTFSDFVREDSDDVETLFGLMMALFYQDRGMATASEYLQRIFQPDGTIDRALIGQIRVRLLERENHYPLPQQPGGVDENIMNIIYCKNLGFLNKMVESLSYNETSGFYSTSSKSERYKETCAQVGVTAAIEQPFNLAEYKVTKPVYYFQGSHDGATHAIGARTHWKTVPQGKSYFMLAQKGGHNPNLTRLSDETKAQQSSPLAEAESNLFWTSVSGGDITPGLIDKVNLVEDSRQKWILYLTPNEDTGFTDELQGILRLPRTKAFAEPL